MRWKLLLIPNIFTISSDILGSANMDIMPNKSRIIEHVQHVEGVQQMQYVLHAVGCLVQGAQGVEPDLSVQPACRIFENQGSNESN